MKKLKIFLAAVFIFTMLCLFSFVSAAQGNVSTAIDLSCEGASKTSVKLTWKSDIPCTSYYIYRAEIGEFYEKVAEVTSRKYKDKNLEEGRAYYYKVEGIYEGGSVFSEDKKAAAMKGVKATAYKGDKSHVNVCWSYPEKELSAVDGFRIYRRTKGEKEYTLIDTYSRKAYFTFMDKTYGYQYTDTTLKKTGTVYFYKVVPYKGEEEGTGNEFRLKLEPYMYVSVRNNSVTVRWTDVKGAEGYEISGEVFEQNNGSFLGFRKKREFGTVMAGDKKELSFDFNIKKYICNISVRAYKTVDGKKKYIRTFEDSTHSFFTLMRSAEINRNSDSVKVINVRGYQRTFEKEISLSEKEKKIFRKFEKLRFREGMSAAEKVSYVLYWIHYNTDYDYDFDISGKYSDVVSVFRYGQGQCRQSNGALVKYLRYLGLKTRLMKGYTRGGRKHFWGEIYLGKQWLCMEAGNYRKNGSWHNLGEIYGQNATGYIICGKTT